MTKKKSSPLHSRLVTRITVTFTSNDLPLKQFNHRTNHHPNLFGVSCPGVNRTRWIVTQSTNDSYFDRRKKTKTNSKTRFSKNSHSTRGSFQIKNLKVSCNYFLDYRELYMFFSVVPKNPILVQLVMKAINLLPPSGITQLFLGIVPTLRQHRRHN